MRLAVALAGIASFAAAVSVAAAIPLRSPATPIAAPTTTPRHTVEPRTAADPSEPPARSRVGPFIVPLAGHAVPSEAELLPESARDYRAGIHEGIDFPADPGTPVLAAADGRIVRIDHGFSDWSASERAAALEAARDLGRTPTATLERIRGRQVWLDHGRGVVTRYAHLDGVAPLALGSHVTAGTVIGFVGSSGYPEGGPHLHFEIRVGESYVGDGLTPAELARALRAAFR